MIFSGDSETIDCPLKDNKNVNIKSTCMEKINPKTQEKGCEYLGGFPVTYKRGEAYYNDMHDKIKEELLLMEKKTVDIVEPNKKVGIDAEYKVIKDDEEEDEEK